MLKLLKKIIYRIIYHVEKLDGGSAVVGRVQGISNVTFEGPVAIVPDGCNFSGCITIGRCTTLGYRNFLSGAISIGRYCQLGADLAMHATDHPVSYMSIYINKMLFDGELKQLKENYRIKVGHDVWIGHGAIIVGNVSVGNGAIIAAGAVVTKDVPEFSIVAGIPARVIRFRFDESVQREISGLKWWDKTEEELEELKPFFFRNFEDAESIHETLVKAEGNI